VADCWPPDHRDSVMEGSFQSGRQPSIGFKMAALLLGWQQPEEGIEQRPTP
jgi:hypothetical protein